MDHLDQLEEKSIYILREAHYHFKDRMALLWSIGKDSTVMLWLVRKAFMGQVPFPLVHVDTNYKIPEMIRYRDEVVKDLKLDMVVGQNQLALAEKNTFPDGKLTRLECCHVLKTMALHNTVKAEGQRLRYNHLLQKYEIDLKKEKFQTLIMGIRSDEEGSRSKERYFSIRSSTDQWKIETMPPEIWDEFNTDLDPDQTMRIHPLLDWAEKNIWEYIVRENIPVTSLYFNQGENTRYRSLGCYPCTQKINSTAKNAKEVLAEISSGDLANVAERSGRAQDKENGNTLEVLRRKGYM